MCQLKIAIGAWKQVEIENKEEERLCFSVLGEGLHLTVESPIINCQLIGDGVNFSCN